MSKLGSGTCKVILSILLVLSTTFVSCGKSEEKWSLVFWESKNDKLLRVFKTTDHKCVILEYSNKLDHDIQLEFEPNDFDPQLLELEGYDMVMKAGKTGRIVVKVDPPDGIAPPYKIPIDIKLIKPKPEVIGEVNLTVDVEKCPDSFEFTWADGTTSKTIEVEADVEFSLKTLLKNTGRSWQMYEMSETLENYSSTNHDLLPGQSKEIEYKKTVSSLDELGKVEIQTSNQCNGNKTIVLELKKKQGTWSANFKDNGKDEISLTYDQISRNDVQVELKNPNTFPVTFHVDGKYVSVKPESTTFYGYDAHRSSDETDSPITINVSALWQTKILTINSAKQDFAMKLVEDTFIKHQFNNCEVMGNTEKGLILGLDLVFNSPYGAFPKSIGFAGYDLKLVWKRPIQDYHYTYTSERVVFANGNKLEALETNTGNPVWKETLESDDVQSISLVGQHALKVAYRIPDNSDQTRDVFYDLVSGMAITENIDSDISGMKLKTDFSKESKENFIEMRNDGKQLWRYKTKKLTDCEDCSQSKTEVWGAIAHFEGEYVIINYILYLPMNRVYWDETLCLDALSGRELWSLKANTRKQAWNEKYYVYLDSPKLVVRDIKTGKILANSELDIYRDSQGIAIIGDSVYISYCPSYVSTYDNFALHHFKITK